MFLLVLFIFYVIIGQEMHLRRYCRYDWYKICDDSSVI